MPSFDEYLDSLLARGRAYFSKEEGLKALGLSVNTFTATATRLAKRRRLVSPRHGFYLILRPEDRAAGAPDPTRWIDPLMKYQKIDYRISLLRAAAFHGSSHQASMVFQVIVPKQLRDIEIGRHRIEFIYQAPEFFKETNRPDWLDQIKSEAGFARVAGIELTLLDCSRYFHKAAGIDGVAQVVHDFGNRAIPGKLAKAADHYENAAVRRLGYLLESFGYRRQAAALEPFASRAKSIKRLDPSIRSVSTLQRKSAKNPKWMLDINHPIEIDA
jgi:predicted transcriptional regulator of viral defense system